MHCVFGAICSKLGSDTVLCLPPRHTRVCGSQKPPPDRNGLITHQFHGNHRARGHKLHQVTEKVINSRVRFWFKWNTYLSRPVTYDVFKCHYSVIKINVTGHANDDGWPPWNFPAWSHQPSLVNNLQRKDSLEERLWLMFHVKVCCLPPVKKP